MRSGELDGMGLAGPFQLEIVDDSGSLPLRETVSLRGFGGEV